MKRLVFLVAVLALLTQSGCRGGAPAPILFPLACTFEPDGTLPDGARWVSTGDGWATLEWEPEGLAVRPLDGAETTRFEGTAGGELVLAANSELAIFTQANRLRVWAQRAGSPAEPLAFTALGGLISARADGGAEPRVVVWSSAEPDAMAITTTGSTTFALEPALDRRLIPDGSGRWLAVRDASTVTVFGNEFPILTGGRVVHLAADVVTRGASAAWVVRRPNGDHVVRTTWEHEAHRQSEHRLPDAPSAVWFADLESGPVLVMAFDDSTLVHALNSPAIPMTELPFQATQMAERAGEWSMALSDGRTGALRCTESDSP